MGAVDIVIALIALALGFGGGFFVQSRQRPAAAPQPAQEPELAPEHIQMNGERIHRFARWLECLSHFYRHLNTTASPDQMAGTMATGICEAFPDLSVLVTIGSIKDVMMVQAMPHVGTQAVDLSVFSCLIARPDLERDLARELATSLYEAVKRSHLPAKHWMPLHEINPSLQASLSQRFHIHGQGLVVPLLVDDTICGILLLAGSSVGASAGAMNDHGQFAVICAEAMATWLRCMAPQLMAGTANDPISLPMQTLASLSILEHSAKAAQESAEAREVLEELAQYSRKIDAEAAETSLLASQTCGTLRRICNADFAMFLKPASEDFRDGFVVEAMETSKWLYTRFLGMQGGEHAPALDEAVLAAWPDRFVDEVLKSGEVALTKRSDEAYRIAATLAGLGLSSLAVIPALVRGRCMAMLVVGREQPGGIADQSIMVGTSVATLAGISLAAMSFLHQRNRLQQSLEESRELSKTLVRQTFETLANIVQKHNLITVNNSALVAHYAEAIATQMHLTPAEVSQVRMAALLCDLGMIIIPTSIVRKESGLTDEEWLLLRSHSEASAEMLSKMDMLRGSLPMIVHHHERYDGTGYPNKLGGASIPLGARIIAVADSFVSIQIERPYRPAASREDALLIIRQESGRQFDPDVVLALMKVITLEDKGRQAA
jgi:hypothetical protein